MVPREKTSDFWGSCREGRLLRFGGEFLGGELLVELIVVFPPKGDQVDEEVIGEIPSEEKVEVPPLLNVERRALPGRVTGLVMGTSIGVGIDGRKACSGEA